MDFSEATASHELTVSVTPSDRFLAKLSEQKDRHCLHWMIRVEKFGGNADVLRRIKLKSLGLEGNLKLTY